MAHHLAGPRPAAAHRHAGRALHDRHEGARRPPRHRAHVRAAGPLRRLRDDLVGLDSAGGPADGRCAHGARADDHHGGRPAWLMVRPSTAASANSDGSSGTAIRRGHARLRNQAPPATCTDGAPTSAAAATPCSVTAGAPRTRDRWALVRRGGAARRHRRNDSRAAERCTDHDRPGVDDRARSTIESRIIAPSPMTARSPITTGPVSRTPSPICTSVPM